MNDRWEEYWSWLEKVERERRERKLGMIMSLPWFVTTVAIAAIVALTVVKLYGH